MKKYYIGVDNGTTGSIGIIDDRGAEYKYLLPPTIKQLHYTKKIKNITRYDRKELKKIFEVIKDEIIKVVIERPYTGSFVNTVAVAAMAYESIMGILEELELSYEIIDSREWQKAMLPKGIKGTPQLKKASMDVGVRLFPKDKDAIKKHKDADGILIAEYARRAKL